MVDAVDMRVNFGGIPMQNPVNTASGCFGYGKQFEGFYDVSRLGAITCKGCSVQSWQGNPEPRMVEIPSGMMNSVGLQNPGILEFSQTAGTYLEELEKRGCRVICQIAGHSIEEYVQATEMYEELMPYVSGFEVNISCPNIACGGAAMGATAQTAYEVVHAIRPHTKKPLIVKMGPFNVTEIAPALEAAGADALSLINTIPGMAIDVHTRKSKLCRPYAGVSGKAIHHIAVHKVYQVAQVVSIPICGIGGIETYEDAAEMILAGATCVGVGMANFYNPMCALEVVEGLTQWCESQGVKHVHELIGAFEC